MLPGEVDGARFLRAAKRFGWSVVRTRGSHRVLRHTDGRTVFVAFHKMLSRNSLRRALNEMRIEEQAFEEWF